MGNHLVEPALNCVVAFGPSRKNIVPTCQVTHVLTNLAIRELHASDVGLRIKELGLCDLGGFCPITSRYV